MEQKSALKSMSPKHRYLMEDIFIAYLTMGTYMILIGSVLPSIKEEYQISYWIGGWMMSVLQIGYLVSGIAASLIAGKIGAKTAYVMLGSFAFIGFAMIMVTGNPVILLFAMLLIGICKGAVGNFGNQITSTLSNNDSSLLNLSQAFFAVGACIAPIISMLCGTSWRTAFAIIIAMGILTILHSTRTEIGPEAFRQETNTGKPDLGFFKKSIFWICCLLLMCYLAFEASLMGWLVTYFVDSGAATDTVAQLLATALWVAVLIGRFSSAWFATRFRPEHMMLVMMAGVVVCFSLLLFSHALIPMAAAVFGVGLFMAGIYGTALGGSDNLIGQYPMCMGMLIVIPGIGSAITQSAIGTLADHVGIRGGMYFLYVVLAVLVFATVLFLRYHSKKKKA